MTTVFRGIAQRIAAASPRVAPHWRRTFGKLVKNATIVAFTTSFGAI